MVKIIEATSSLILFLHNIHLKMLLEFNFRAYFFKDLAYSNNLMSWSLLSPLNRKLAPLEMNHDN